MKKKTVWIIACIAALAVAFAGCGKSNFGVVVNEDLNVEITAENADEGMIGATGAFTVGEGDDVKIEPNFEEGKVLVEFYPMEAAADANADAEDFEPKGKPEFDVEVSGTEPIECGFAAGDYMVNATVLEKTNGTAVISLITAEEKDPWTKVSSAAEAAKGAGTEDFEVPQQLQINDLTFSDPAFSYLDKVAQAYYEEGAIGIYVRKASGIYGGPMTDRDLDSFPEHWTQQVGDDADDVVDCYGMEKGSAIVIQWGDTEDCYTVTSQGLGGEEYGMDKATVDRLEDVID